MLRVRLRNPNEPVPAPVPEVDEDEEDDDSDEADDTGGDDHTDEEPSEAKGPVCPFCARAVDHSLLQYGGQCPGCFGEIPGEEAATDPGEEKRRAERDAAKKRVHRSKRIPMLLGSLLVMFLVCGSVGTASFMVLYTPEMPVLDLDDPAYDLGELSTMVAYVEPKEVVVPGTHDPGTSKVPHPPRPQTHDLGTVDPGTPDAVATNVPDDLHGPRPVPGTPDMLREPGVDLHGTGTTGGPHGLDVVQGVQRLDHSQDGVMLKDDDQIIDMVKRIVTTELPKLRYQCYERTLKVDETVAGTWVLEFTVNTRGSVQGATVTPKDNGGNQALEQCISGVISQWKFQPIKANLPVHKSVKFSSAG